MEVSDARRLKALEDENRRLTKLLAEAMLDVATLREAVGEDFFSLIRRRALRRDSSPRGPRPSAARFHRQAHLARQYCENPFRGSPS